jgi:hypothetical protein
VSGRLDRALSFFLAPAAPAEPVRAVALPPAARVVVIGTPRDVVAVAAAAVLDGPAPGVVALWRGERAPTAGVATRAAARLATALSNHELPTVARGRLAWLTLPDEPDRAATAVRHASALVPGPFVTALAGARPQELERLIAEHDLAIVAAPPDTALARAALAGFRTHGMPATAVAPLGRGLARTLALAGITAPRLDAPRAAATVREGP